MYASPLMRVCLQSVYMTSTKETTANAALLSYSSSLITAKPSAIRWCTRTYSLTHSLTHQLVHFSLFLLTSPICAS